MDHILLRQNWTVLCFRIAVTENFFQFQLVNKRDELVHEMDDQERAIEDDEETEMKVARKVPEITADKSCAVM